MIFRTHIHWSTVVVIETALIPTETLIYYYENDMLITVINL